MKIVFLFYNGMTALDMVGPHEVLTRVPGVQVERAALNKGAIKTSQDLIVIADKSLKDVNEADLLIIPGARNKTTLKESPEILDWIRKINEKSTFTTSVCTGSLILGEAGLLNGLKATSHASCFETLKTFGAIPLKERIVQDGKIITAAGVSAGIDMGLYLASKIGGKEIADSIQKTIEYKTD